MGVQWSRFQRLRTRITWLPVLRAASRVSGRAILPLISQLLQINLVSKQVFKTDAEKFSAMQLAVTLVFQSVVVMLSSPDQKDRSVRSIPGHIGERFISGVEQIIQDPGLC